MVTGWAAVTAAAVVVGVLAVGMVGDSIRDRGPLGNETVRSADVPEGKAVVDPDASRIRDSVTGRFGEFVVECRGLYAVGVAARPDRDAGWRTVSYEPGPDDDVDAVFSHRGRSVEMEVYCNRGRPTVSELEWKTLPDD